MVGAARDRTRYPSRGSASPGPRAGTRQCRATTPAAPLPTDPCRIGPTLSPSIALDPQWDEAPTAAFGRSPDASRQPCRKPPLAEPIQRRVLIVKGILVTEVMLQFRARRAALSGGRCRAKPAAEKLPSADNHPGARRATPPESGGELLKMLPSSDEEGWRAERRGGCLEFFRSRSSPALPGNGGDLLDGHQVHLVLARRVQQRFGVNEMFNHQAAGLGGLSPVNRSIDGPVESQRAL